MSLKLQVREPTADDFLAACQSDSGSKQDDSQIETTKLASDDVERLLARAEYVQAEDGDEKEFHRREKTMPAPRTGDMIDMPFPPDEPLEKPPEVLAEEEAIRSELKVIRTMPEGEDLETVPQVVVTFNQPMVPVTGVDELKNFPVPVEITPEIEGEWRWVGTKCVKWKPSHRLPKSTVYEVKIPAGVSSQWGCALAETVTFGFSTKRLSISDWYPHNRYGNPPKAGPNPMIYVQFNQRVDPEYIVSQLGCAGMPAGCEIQCLSLEEVRRRLDMTGPGCEPEESYLKKKRYYHYSRYETFLRRSIDRLEDPAKGVDYVWIAFSMPLPLSSGFTIQVPNGTLSAEGPRPSTALSAGFSTYGPLVIRERYPRLHDRILPLRAWSVYFSNNLELDVFDPAKHVRVTPEVEDLVVVPSGDHVSIRGKTKGRVRYTVTFDSSLTDVYSQTLGKDTSVEFPVGPARQSLSGFFNGQMIVHDVTMNGDDPCFSVVSCNLAKARVCVFQVHPKEWHKSGFGPDYYYHTQSWDYYHDKTPSECVNAGTKVYDEVIDLTTDPDEMGETVIHLKEYLQHPEEIFGQIVVFVEPHQGSWTEPGDWRHRPRVKTWVQCTKTGLDAFSSTGGSVYFLATNLADGSNVEVGSSEFTILSPKGTKVDLAGYSNELSVRSGRDGMGLIVGGHSGNSCAWVARGNDVSFVTGVSSYASNSAQQLAYIINDRNLYKPNETVSIKGIIRRMNFQDWAKVLEYPSACEVSWEAFDARSAKFKSGTVAMNEFGSFFLEIVLPDNINLGDARVRFNLPWGASDHHFKVQEFRTPEFTAVTKVPAGPYLVNGVAIVTGIAEYFSGGGMQGCQVNWETTQSNTSYTPPGYSFKGFSFGCGWRPIKPPPPPPPGAVSAPVISSKPMPSSFSGRRRRPRKRPSRRRKIARLEDVLVAEPKFTVSESILPTISGGRHTLAGSTNAEGQHKLCVDFRDNEEEEVKTPVAITSKVNIQDINRQTMGSSSTFIVHPSRLYVGLKLKKSYTKAGEPLPLDVVVTDIDGNSVSETEVNIRVILRYSAQKGYRTFQVEEVVEEIDFVSDDEPKELTLRMPDGGQFFVVAKVKDDTGLPNFASASIWVAGGSRGPKGGSKIALENVQIIANKKEYQPGDVAKLLITSPFEGPAEGVLFAICNGFAEKQRFHLDEQSIVVDVPVKREYIPGFNVRVSLSGTNDRIDERTGRPSTLAPKRPAFASGSLNLVVPSAKNTIECEVIPEKAIMRPGEEGTVRVQLTSTDEEFVPAGSMVSCIIVDEAVLSLTGYNLPHPIQTFYPGNSSTFQTLYLRSSVVMKDWSSIEVLEPRPPPKPRCRRRRKCKKGGKSCCLESCQKCCLSRCCCLECEEDCEERCCKKDCCCLENEDEGEDTAGADEEEDSKIEVRTNFNPLACFIHDAAVDDEGKAVVNFTLPDNLTRYRIWCLASRGTTHYGLGESSLQAQLPVAIRPSLPRFLNFGDVAEFCVVVQNQTLDAITVNIAVRMTNLALVDPTDQGVRVTIPYTKRAELRFPVRTHKVGTGRFQVVGAVAGTSFADAVEKSLPIFTPSTSEAFATYGELDGDGVVKQPILPPADIYNQFGGLSVTTSSTALQALTDAFLYVVNYKFDCCEQASSRILSICGLQNILSAFNVPGMPSLAELRKIVGTGITKIKRVQRSDGAVGFWTIHSHVNIYISIYVTHALLRAELQGYTVDQTALSRGKSFCQNVNTYIDRYCGWYGPYSRASLRSFALYVLAVFALNDKLTPPEKDYVVKEGESLHASLEEYLSHEGKAWLMLAVWACSSQKRDHPIVQKIHHWIMNNVNETPETANFITSYGDDGKLVMLHSNRRTDGVMLECLIHVDEGNYLIPKIVKGLLAHRKKGRWGSTQENAYILLSLKLYFEVFEKLEPDFIARVWLGEDYCGQVEFHGRETDYKNIKIPMKVLLPDADEPEQKDLVLWKQGQGRLYYRLGMEYAPRDLDLKAIDYGFIVERTYEPVTNASHVTRDPENGLWTFKAGELVRVKLTLTNVSRRYHVALVDFIPAGCEVLNPDLKGGQQVPKGIDTTAGSVTGRSASNPYRWCWWWYYRKWYEHVNRRDERVEAFTGYLYCGVHEFEYLMSCTSLGEFVIPPAKAEEMYSPEIFGRSASEKVIIKY